MSPKTVLLVEDSEDTRDIYGTMLQHHGYRVLEAASGEDGIRMAKSELPDIIVMNLSLPEVDGISAAHTLKRDAQTGRIPIIACTGFVVEDGGDQAEDAGCDSYLEKPCEPTRILEEVQRFIGPAPPK
jgi:two-component system, cell cycle response regulator DivK